MVGVPGVLHRAPRGAGLDHRRHHALRSAGEPERAAPAAGGRRRPRLRPHRARGRLDPPGGLDGRGSAPASPRARSVRSALRRRAGLEGRSRGGGRPPRGDVQGAPLRAAHPAERIGPLDRARRGRRAPDRGRAGPRPRDRAPAAEMGRARGSQAARESRARGPTSPSASPRAARRPAR